MKMTVEKAHASALALQALAQVALPGTIAYRIAVLMEEFEPILKRVEKAHNAALKLHGVPVKDAPGRYGLKDPMKFNEEMESVMSQEVELAVSEEKIDTALLMETKIPANVFIALKWLFSETAGWR